MATSYEQFAKFDPCISQGKKHVLPKNTCLAKALQNCETILLFLYCVFVSYVSGSATRLTLF